MADYQFSSLPIDTLPEELKPVLAYWQDLKGERLAPSWPEFDMMKIPPAVLPYTMIKDVITEPRGYRYRYFGTALTHMYSELTGKTLDQVNNRAFGRVIFASLEEFTAAFKPQYYRVFSNARTGRAVVHYLMRLPLSSDQKQVSNIVSIMSDHIGKDEYQKIAGEWANGPS